MEQQITPPMNESNVEKVGVFGFLKKNLFLVGGILFIIINIGVLAFCVAQVNKVSHQVEQLYVTLIEQDKQITMLSVAAYMSEGVVTDELVIQKAYFYRSGTGLSVDIRPQPSFAYHVQGQGRFDLSDRELKSVLLTLIDEIEKQFNDEPGLPPFSSLSIDISQNNYEVATYENGKLKLKGE